MNSLSEIAAHLHRVVRAYREEHARCVKRLDQSNGSGLLPVASIWTSEDDLEVMVVADGLILTVDREPADRWYFSGGPAIKLDLAHTRTPLQVRVLLGMGGGSQQPAGIARAILTDEPLNAVWRGEFGAPVERLTETLPCKRRVRLARYDLGMEEALRRATFGFYGDIVKLESMPGPLPVELVRNLGFFPADLNSRRFFQWLCIAGACNTTTQPLATVQEWAERTVREDIARTFVQTGFEPVDFISQTAGTDIWSRRLRERLEELETAEQALEQELHQPVPGSSRDTDAPVGHAAIAADILRRQTSMPPFQSRPRDPAPDERPATHQLDRRAANDLVKRSAAMHRLLLECSGCRRKAPDTAC